VWYNGGVKFKNHTKFDSQLIREIIAFVKPNGVSKFDITLKNSRRGWRGLAYTHGCGYHNSWAPLVIIGVPLKTTEDSRYKSPRRTDHGGGYLPSVQNSPVEDMVHLIAHELRHLWQKKVKKGHRVWGARGQYSERDADAYAIAAVRRWVREPNTHS
jgi:hypothetical protein